MVGVLAKHEIEYWEYLQEQAHKDFPEIFDSAFKQGRKVLHSTFVHVGNLSQMKKGYSHAIVLSLPKDVELKMKNDLVKYMTK